ncbi:hypothetical protein Tco_1075316 [Tanacetum coccineum]
MTQLEGVVRFTNGTDEIAYKMPHKIEQYNSLLDLEKEHTKSVYLRNEEDKRRGAEYVMSKIIGFYKECLELRPEYLTGMDDEGEVTWGKLMEEFKLENHKWLTKMFNICSSWIPAYFIDSLLCGLMRTTSRSETMKKQRHVKERLDHKTIDIVSKLKSDDIK